MHLSATVPLPLHEVLQRLLDCPCGMLSEGDPVIANAPSPDSLPEMLVSGLPLRWEQLYFSNAGEDLLRRYYSQQFYWLTQALDARRDDEKQHGCKVSEDELLVLIRLLLTGYDSLLEESLTFPARVLHDWLGPWRQDADIIIRAMQVMNGHEGLTRCLGLYLDTMTGLTPATRFSICEFRYADQLIAALSAAISAHPGNDYQDPVISTLLRHNFNHFAFLSYCRQQHQTGLTRLNWQQQQSYVQKAQEELLEYPLRPAAAYDKNWPSVREHLHGWLQQMDVPPTVSNRVAGTDATKLQLNLSVAHLSCLLRALYEINMFKGESLAGVFRVVSAAVSTKKQPVISPTSLKKEYYSVSQFTAARVMDMLQQMIGQLNRHYFPVLVAVSVILAAAPENL